MRLEDDAEIIAPDNNYKQFFAPTITQTSATSIQVKVSRLGMPLEPNTYKVIYRRVISRQTPGTFTSTTINDANNPKTITGLVEGATYRIETQAVGPSSVGNTLTVYFTMVPAAVDPKIAKGIQDFEDPELKLGGRSYLELTGGEAADNKYTYVYRDFNAITVPTNTPIALNVGTDDKHKDFAPRYQGAATYYSFGTSFVFPPLKFYKPQEAGIGLFLSNSTEDGYWILFSTSGTAAARNTNPVRIMKVSGKQIKVLKDSQKGNAATLDSLFSGSVNYIDIKVKVEGQKIDFNVYVNGFGITATDENSASSPYNKILPVTKRVGLVAASGTVSFDYVYATDLKVEDYNRQGENNIYTGQFSDDFLETEYGDLAYVADAEDGLSEIKLDSYDEFGTVAREILKREVKFGSGASFPNAWTTAGNKRVNVLASDVDNFGASVFVLNNTSSTVPVADGELNSLAVYGYKIGFSGDIEYTTEAASEFAVAEPVNFESTWLQNEADVKSLADWIKSRVVNKAKIITMTVFGNPLLSVGDIVNVKYDYQGFLGTERIIVTHITHSYKDGLETTVKGRTLGETV